MLGKSIIQQLCRRLRRRTKRFPTIRSIQENIVWWNSIFYPLSRTMRMMNVSNVLIFCNNRTRNLPRIMKGRKKITSNFKRLPFIRKRRSRIARVRIAHFRRPRCLRTSNKFSIRKGINENGRTIRRSLRHIYTRAARFTNLCRTRRTISRNMTFRRELTMRLIRSIFRIFFLTMRSNRFTGRFNRMTT